MQQTINGKSANVINMSLTYHWFDRILSGKKKIEYREGKDYWHNRLRGQKIDYIRFSRGYTSTFFIIEVKGIKANKTGIIDNENFEKNFSEGTVTFDACEPEDTSHYEIKLGNIVMKSNDLN